jgi:hypothetical protein
MHSSRLEGMKGKGKRRKRGIERRKIKILRMGDKNKA